MAAAPTKLGGLGRPRLLQRSFTPVPATVSVSVSESATESVEVGRYMCVSVFAVSGPRFRTLPFYLLIKRPLANQNLTHLIAFLAGPLPTELNLFNDIDICIGRIKSKRSAQIETRLDKQLVASIRLLANKMQQRIDWLAIWSATLSVAIHLAFISVPYLLENKNPSFCFVFRFFFLRQSCFICSSLAAATNCLSYVCNDLQVKLLLTFLVD